MSQDHPFPLRHVHLDFHTPENIPGFLEEFDAQQLVRTMCESDVQALVFFSKDHYGNSYYLTSAGHRHVQLERDALREVGEAARDTGLSIYAYYSLMVDNHAAREHPKWAQVNPDGKPCVLGDRWRTVCINSPYAAFALSQIEELADYPIDGIWLDMVGFYTDCHCVHCQRRYRGEPGASWPPGRAGTPQLQRYRDWQMACLEDFLRQSKEVLRSRQPGMLQMINSSSGIIEKVRGQLAVHDDALVEEACLSSPTHFTLESYFARSFRCDPARRPFQIVTQRFLQGWGDWTLRSADVLKYEGALICAHGGCVSIGDQMYGDGRIEPAVYRRIAEVNRWLAERDPWFAGTEAASEVGVYNSSPGHATDPGGMRYPSTTPGDHSEGTVRSLMEEHWQFDIITPWAVPASGATGGAAERWNLVVDAEQLRRYRAVVLDQSGPLSTSEAGALREYVRGGGNLLVIGAPGLAGRDNPLADVIGVEFLGPCGYDVAYIDEPAPEISSGLPEIPILVRADGYRMGPVKGARALAFWTYPARPESGEFYSHQHGYPSQATEDPAIIEYSFGRGRCITIAAPIGRAYWLHLYEPLRRLLHNCLAYLVPNRMIETNAPTTCEVVAVAREGATIVHLLFAHSERPGPSRPGMLGLWTENFVPMEQIPPIGPITLVARLDHPVRRAVEQPSGRVLDHTEQNGRVAVTVEWVEIHTAVVFEH